MKTWGAMPVRLMSDDQNGATNRLQMEQQQGMKRDDCMSTKLIKRCLANQNRNKMMAGVLKPVVRVGGRQAHGCGSECQCLGSR